jgi:hypothetical protein
MIPGKEIIKRPCKIVIIDETVTEIIFRDTFTSVPIKDEATKGAYWMERTPVKKGLQMTGD